MFIQDEFMGRRVLKSSLLGDKDVAVFFTTRDLPLKAGEREDLIEEVEDNKKLVCEGLGIPFENLVIPVQTHSDNIICIDAKTHRCIENLSPSTSQPLNPSPYHNTDALVTDQPQIALALNFADCVPIIFYDSVKKVIAAAHAGWRGTASKIGVKTIQKMMDEFGCEPENIVALIGPAIGKCCFEVNDDVKTKLLETLDETVKQTWKFGSLETWSLFCQACESSDDKYYIDLKQINKFQLLAMGLEKIDVCEDCTSCKNELFFSYRKENGNCARHSAVIMMKGKQKNS